MLKACVHICVSVYAVRCVCAECSFRAPAALRSFSSSVTVLSQGRFSPSARTHVHIHDAHPRRRKPSARTNACIHNMGEKVPLRSAFLKQFLADHRNKRRYFLYIFSVVHNRSGQIKLWPSFVQTRHNVSLHFQLWHMVLFTVACHFYFSFLFDMRVWSQKRIIMVVYFFNELPRPANRSN